jgi:Recombination endonuclease VII
VACPGRQVPWVSYQGPHHHYARPDRRVPQASGADVMRRALFRLRVKLCQSRLARPGRDQLGSGVTEWIAKASLPVAAPEDLVTVRVALNVCARRLDGKPAAATTATRRKRAVLANAIGYSIEFGLLMRFSVGLSCDDAPMERELPSLGEWLAWRDSLLPAPCGVPCAGTDYDRRAVWIILRMIQGHRCAICLRGTAGEMDYDRVTGRIQGLLCERCNAVASEGTRHPVLDAYRARPPVGGQVWLYGPGGGTEPEVTAMTDAELQFATDMGRLIEAGDAALDAADDAYRWTLKRGCDAGLLAVFGSRIGEQPPGSILPALAGSEAEE